MENPRPEKVATVAEIAAKLRSADAAILTEYRGLTVSQMAGIRRQLREAGSEWKVYKNSLARLAALQTGAEALSSELVGPTAVAFVKGDVAAAAKVLREASKVNPQLVLKGGVMGDKILSAKDVEVLADLPSRETLLAMFAGLLTALPRNLAYGLKALIDQKESEAVPAE
ncbi:MAG: 50S ribosomal protein L10 [Actinomycetota bacterium]